MKKIVSTALFFLLLTGVVFANGGSQATYPTKDIEFLVPVNAGGGTDAISRKIAQLAEPYLDGKTFYLVNKPGASDAVGPNLVMGARADGYTVGSATGGSVTTAVYHQLIPGYDLAKLEFLALVTEEADALIAKKNSYKTFDELIQGAKANPGRIRIGATDVGSRQDLTIRRIEKNFGVEFAKIQYTSSAPQREALMNNEVDLIINSLGDFSSIINSGDAVPIVEFSSSKNLTFPTAPCLTDVGLSQEFLSGSFVSVIVPAGTPAIVRETLVPALEKAAKSKEFIDWCTSVGVSPRFIAGSDLAAYIKAKQDVEFAGIDELKRQGLM